jgi:ATP-binding cassette subfamily F protein 3
MPDPLLVIDGGEVGYGKNAGEKIILRKLELTLRPGERLGLLGRNGAGKSTLIKLLARELTLHQGKRVEGKELSIGYFAQHQLEQLRPQESPLQHMMRLAPETREQELRDFLGGFDFRGDMAATPCVSFSGGEKSRLALALLIWRKPNLLLLDEPTNHLDLEMRHALSMALQQYDGGVVMVSHDRAMLRTTCDRFMLVTDGKAEVFDGDLEDYRQWLASTDKPSPLMQQKPAQANSYAQNKAERQARLIERRPLLKEVEVVEKKLTGWQAEIQALEQQLADPALYQGTSSAQLQTLLKRQGELAGLMESAEQRWLELHEQLEAIPD